MSGLHVGSRDLFEPFGIDRTQTMAGRHVRLRVRLRLAAAAGVAARDDARANVADIEGSEEECRFTRRPGHAGESRVHPSQVPIADRCPVPDEAEVARARRVLAATGAANGVGAFTVDGRMVAGPFIDGARALVAVAEAAARARDR